MTFLKMRDKTFGRIFLLRGICSTEVDNLIDDPAYYQFIYIPNLVRWQQLKKYPTQ